MPSDLNFMIEKLLEGTAIIEPKGSIADKLTQSYASGVPLRVKLGFDPTAPDLHLGHAVVAKKLRQFQEYGHTVVVIIGDYTARRGDPSGRKDTRPPLTKEQSDANAQTYLDQIGIILDLNKIEIHRNSSWYSNKTFDDALDLSQQFNIARLFERKDFGDRYAARQSITLSELMYPALQGQDSVEICADIEIGGTDQLYNLLVGRDLQRNAGQEPQAALCMPILPGTDGIIKMSKSKNNYIGLTENPSKMFQQIMALKDKVMDGDEEIQVVRTYVDLLIDDANIKNTLLKTISDIENGAIGAENYVTVKKGLAFDVVRQFHGEQAAMYALKHSERIQSLGLGSARMVSHDCSTTAVNGISLIDLCRDLLISSSIEPKGSNNPKRLIENGSVKINGEVNKEPASIIYPRQGMILAIGKKLAFEIKTENLTPPNQPYPAGP